MVYSGDSIQIRDDIDLLGTKYYNPNWFAKHNLTTIRPNISLWLFLDEDAKLVFKGE